MAAKLIGPTEPIDVQQICCLIYGQPGARKSSLAQTAEEPITLAFDPGIYRAFGRKTAALFETWQDVLEFDLTPYRTIVVDTAGMALEKLAQAITQDNPKNGNRLGGLSLPGYGVLKTQFANWVSRIRQAGQSLVFIAHEKVERNGEDAYCCPDIVGGSYNTLMNHCDVVGYLHFANGRRVSDWTPTDQWMAKTPPCGWTQIPLPDFQKDPTFLARLLAEARASMGRVSEASAAVAAVVAKWQDRLKADPTLPQLNEMLKELSLMKNGLKAQCWHLIREHAEHGKLTFDKETRAFVDTEV